MKQNPVNHFEIVAEDLDRAKSFYKTVFGWEIMNIPELEYSMVMTTPTDEKQMPKEKGAINGGMMKKDDSAPYPLVVITIEDMDVAIKRVEENGGKLLHRTEIPNMGLYARVKDSEGSIIGLWEVLEQA